MDKRALEELLKNVLEIKKELIALKPLKEIPDNIPEYQGIAAPGLCAQIGEVLKDNTVFYTTRKNHVCFEGLIATGVHEVSRQEYREALNEFIDACPYHKNIDTAMDFYEKCIETIPIPKLQYKCLLVGPLSKVKDPDLVILFCTPKQAEVLNRSQAYLGNITRGFGGNGGCIFNIRQAFITREPTFSTSDFPWRTFTGLDDSELTVTYPYEKLIESAPVIKPVIDYIDSLKAMFENP